MIYSTCCRSALTANLSNAGGIYLEAFLNNLNAPNGSAKLANHARPYFRINTANTLSLQATDVEGDSIAYELISAREPGAVPSSSSPVAYSGGYSALQPVGGTATTLNNATATLQLTPPSTGRYVIALRVKDYRAGQLVGYSEREWDAIVTSVGSQAPLPASSNLFHQTSCPGQTSSIQLTFQDPGDSVIITAAPGTNMTWPVTVGGGTGLGSATATLSWTTPASLSVSTTPYFYIRLMVRDSNCPVRGIAWHDVLVRTAYCSTDTVWAGDADANKVVDLYDPLAIAVASGKTGPARPGASTAWAPQTCANWTTSFLNGINHKHADCDGNGTVNNNDLNAVTLNYGQSHPRPGEEAEQPKTAGLPDLFFDKTGISANRGSTVVIPIKLGTSGSQMANLYGLAARIQIQNVTPATSATISYPASWLGTTANTMRFTAGAGTTALDWAYARTTGTATSGDGTLAHLSIPIPASTLVGTKMILRFTQPRLISANGTELTDYNVLSDTLTILAEAGIDDAASSVRDAFVVPNPSGREAALHLASRADAMVSIADAVGRIVWTETVKAHNGTAVVSLPAARMAGGMYLIRVAPVDGSAVRVVKWVRE